MVISQVPGWGFGLSILSFGIFDSYLTVLFFSLPL